VDLESIHVRQASAFARAPGPVKAVSKQWQLVYALSDIMAKTANSELFEECRLLGYYSVWLL
jgi:hypothetical protein